MADNKNRLGRGLGNVFPAEDLMEAINAIESNATQENTKYNKIEIDVNEIRPNPYQPRKEFDKKALEELADSIRTHGIFTPLLVRKSEVSGYDLVTGERRLRAAKLAGLEKVPVIEVTFSDTEMMEISILENVQREDLNPIEEAYAYESLVRKLGYTQEKLADRVGKSREYCANMMRLLKLPDGVQKLVVEKKLTMGHVRPLLSLKDDDQIYDAASYVLKNKLSVREVEQYVHELSGTTAKKVKRTPQQKDPWIKDLENRIQNKLQTEVNITKRAMTISYSDTEDLNRILEILGCLEESEEGKA